VKIEQTLLAFFVQNSVVGKVLSKKCRGFHLQTRRHRARISVFVEFGPDFLSVFRCLSSRIGHLPPSRKPTIPFLALLNLFVVHQFRRTIFFFQSVRPEYVVGASIVFTKPNMGYQPGQPAYVSEIRTIHELNSLEKCRKCPDDHVGVLVYFFFGTTEVILEE